ncbi:hypothetical protein TSUD_299220 [Trifolium subterraneum]|nr:hypothetical protein TSUD_299220 [Trifolium subterraneum]
MANSEAMTQGDVVVEVKEDERQVQRSYWKEHCADLSVESMMLDSNASNLDKEERPEVLSLLPEFEGKSVLELGAGIGRFTSELAQKAGQLLAVDFIESAIKKNENTNGHYKNVKFMCADVTSPNLHISEGSVDLIFSNWLLMYLSDEEVFKECHMSDENGNSFELSLVGCKCIGAYVRNKKNQNQICWIWEKVKSQDDRGFQRFLDSVEYNHKDILLYEHVYGQGFVSTGGLETTREIVAKLGLKPGQKVLDVGCGIGGGDFYMAENFDVEVVAIDLSINMISLAIERAIGLKYSVEFECVDCTKKSYSENTFDVIYTRDTLLHIKMLENAGFDDVIAEDQTNLFLKTLQMELNALENKKIDFIDDFSEDDYNEIVERWKAKQMRGVAGEQIWGLFIAKKK